MNSGNKAKTDNKKWTSAGNGTLEKSQIFSEVMISNNRRLMIAFT